ncbi:MAG: hypothetical protein U1E89_04575 [Burkholderiaceae bacterium]
MNFCFDANLPPAIACAIAALSDAEEGVGRIVHLRELFPPGTDDLVWIPGLKTHGDDWYVVSQDKFRKSKGAEREALRREGYGVYVLEPAWSSHPYWAKCAQLVVWWPQVLQHARLTRGGVHRVPWRHTARKKFESI